MLSIRCITHEHKLEKILKLKLAYNGEATVLTGTRYVTSATTKQLKWLQFYLLNLFDLHFTVPQNRIFGFNSLTVYPSTSFSHNNIMRQGGKKDELDQSHQGEQSSVANINRSSTSRSNTFITVPYWLLTLIMFSSLFKALYSLSLL